MMGLLTFATFSNRSWIGIQNKTPYYPKTFNMIRCIVYTLNDRKCVLIDQFNDIEFELLLELIDKVE